MQYHRHAIFFTVDLHIKEIEGLLVYGIELQGMKWSKVYEKSQLWTRITRRIPRVIIISHVNWTWNVSWMRNFREGNYCTASGVINRFSGKYLTTLVIAWSWSWYEAEACMLLLSESNRVRSRKIKENTVITYLRQASTLSRCCSHSEHSSTFFQLLRCSVSLPWTKRGSCVEKLHKIPTRWRLYLTSLTS